MLIYSFSTRCPSLYLSKPFSLYLFGVRVNAVPTWTEWCMNAFEHCVQCCARWRVCLRAKKLLCWLHIVFIGYVCTCWIVLSAYVYFYLHQKAKAYKYRSRERERDENRVKKEENQFQSAVPVEELEEWPIITIIIEIPTKKRYTNKTANWSRVSSWELCGKWPLFPLW